MDAVLFGGLLPEESCSTRFVVLMFLTDHLRAELSQSRTNIKFELLLYSSVRVLVLVDVLYNLVVGFAARSVL